MSMSGGGSTQTSKPLTPQEMQAYYNQALSNLAGLMPGGEGYQAGEVSDAPATPARGFARLAEIAGLGSGSGLPASKGSSFGITAPSYVAPTQQTLTGGDYEALTKAYTAPLDRAKSVDMAASDQAMADRGIFTSRNAITNNNDVSERYAPQYAAAGGQAIGMKANELTQGNTMAMQNAERTDASKWRPADYLAQLWGGGKASQSSGSSINGGFSI